MTQSALDQYALANGFGKTTQAMSEGEKVALRYKFVQDQLSLASGDFIRTSDGWANQVRVLKLQFDSLKATLGQGLINVLTPVIKVINTIIGKLMSLANAFKAFTEMVTGKKGRGASAQTAGMDAVADAAENASGAMGGAGGAAKKAAKDIKGATTGLDELNVMSAPDASDSGGGSGSGAGGGYTADEFDMGEVDTSAVDGMDSKYQGLIDKAIQLKNLFEAGFKVGFGDTSVLERMRESIQSIEDSLTGIFTSPDVQAAANRFVNILVINLGKAAGSVASVGATIADNLLGGISLFLEQNSKRIQEYLVSMLNIESRRAEILGNFSQAVAVIFEAFRSDDAKQITADIIGIFSGGFMGATELMAQFGVDVLDALTAPFIQNKDLIKQTLEDTFSAVEPIFSQIKSIVDEVFTKLKATYDEYVAPMIDSFKQGFTEIVEALLVAYNQHILPVLQGLSDKFAEFRDQYLSPLIDKFMEFAGKVAEYITYVWENVTKPFILWLIEFMGPVISDTLQVAIDMFFQFWQSVSEAVGYILDALGNVIDFLKGIFTGDWEMIWTAVKDFISNIWEAIKSLLVAALTSMYGTLAVKLEFIRSIIENVLNIIKEKWDEIWNGILSTIHMVWENITTAISDKISIIATAVSGFVDGMKQVFSGLIDFVTGVFTGNWSKAWEGVQNIFKGIFNGIVSLLEGAMNFIVDGINRVLSGINEVVEAVGDVIGLDMSIPTMKKVSLPRLAQGGFVKANTPQLAMIGDNRHHGEIVAPEDKMQEMVNRAVSMASGQSSMSDQYLSVMVDLLKKIIELIEGLDLTVNIDIREIKKKLVDLEKRSGFTMRTT